MDRINDYRDFEKLGISMSKSKMNGSRVSRRKLEEFAAMRVACLETTTNYESIQETIQ